MNALYRRLAFWIARHRFAVLCLWALVLVVSSWSAREAPGLLDANSGALKGTPAQAVEDTLMADFDNPFIHSLAVVFSTDSGSFKDHAFQTAVKGLAADLGRLPGVARVIVPDASFGRRFRGADGKGFALLVGLVAKSMPESERMIPAVRGQVAASLAGKLPGWTWAVTGQTAVIYDLNLYNAEDSRRAELRALPLTLLVLLLVFGSLVAVALPLSLGIFSTLLALALVPVFVRFGPLNILYQNMVTLLGLALGIDYSLFMVSRYRESRAAGMPKPEALADMMGSTGVAVSYSGLTVLVGLAGLLFTPLFEFKSMAVGGMSVVALSLLLTLTLLPALLDLLEPWLESPAALSRRLRIRGSQGRWERWTALVTRAPRLFLALGLLVLLALSWPLLSIKPGFPDKPWFPKDMEATKGLMALGAMGQAQELTPVDLLVSAEPGKALLPAHIDDLFRLSAQLKADPRVARLTSPVDLKDGLQEFQYRMLYMNFDQALQAHPELGGLVLSRGRDQALFQIVLKDGVGYAAGKAYVRSLATLKSGPLRLRVGGHWAFTNDFDTVLLKSYPVVFGVVLAVTFLVLFFAFRSVLVPFKALLLNALSVSAAFGATVMVFQWGWGCRWLGMDGPSGFIPLNVPLMVFCITFGLSMDYEVLILSRVREEYLLGHGNTGSVRRGMIATGGLISGAAAIMAAVFGAFSMAEVILVKMLGFGLVVAVLADALVVRAMMVPAAMTLAGKWNWWPGLSKKER